MNKPRTQQNVKEKTPSSAIPQYKLGMILLMFAWPIAWFMFLIYVIAPMLVRANGAAPTWAVITISILGNGAELIAAFVIFKREGYRLTLSSLKERIHWRLPKNWKTWLGFLAVFLAAFALSMLLNPTVLVLFCADSIGGTMAATNATLALQNAVLAAEAIGLGCFYTGFVVTISERNDSIAKFVGLPDTHKIYGALAMGYPKVKYKNWPERNPAKVTWIGEN